VKLYLPRLSGPAQMLGANEVAGRPLRGSGESVLVVEDDVQVRMMVSTVLTDFGYRVAEAADAQSALRMLEGDSHVQLMITDVGLPGVNGRQLAEMARQSRPDLPVLFVTGYAEKAAVRSEFLDAGMHMISKPFSVEALTGAVREALDG
jgi:CheY-like chemotaxis protein